MLLGIVSTSCISEKYDAEPAYGVAMLDQDQDGFYEYDDCDDNDPNIGEGRAWYADTDKDVYGDPDDSLVDCDQPDGYVDNDSDCNDQDETINPDATETVGDSIDSNCNGNNDD